MIKVMMMLLGLVSVTFAITPVHNQYHYCFVLGAEGIPALDFFPVLLGMLNSTSSNYSIAFIDQINVNKSGQGNCQLTMGNMNCLYNSPDKIDGDEVIPYMYEQPFCSSTYIAGPVGLGTADAKKFLYPMSISDILNWSTFPCSTTESHWTLMYDKSCSPAAPTTCCYYSNAEKWQSSFCQELNAPCPIVDDFKLLGNKTVNNCNCSSDSSFSALHQE